MSEETYWAGLGRGISSATYAQSLMETREQRDSALRDQSTVAVIEIKFNAARTMGTYITTALRLSKVLYIHTHSFAYN